jgi:hypothetical protein
MAKNWTTIPTINDIPKYNKTREDEKRASNLIRKTKTLNYLDLKAEGDDAFKVKKAEDDNLISLYEDKKLKSKKLIKKAQNLIKNKKDKKGGK